MDSRIQCRATTALQQAIMEFLAVCNEQPKPFMWTGTVDMIQENSRAVAKRSSRSNSAACSRDVVERLEIALDHAVVTDLAVTAAVGNRHVDRFFVHVQPYEHATVLHDQLPRCVALCDAVRRDTSSTN
jgi:hypothetical protein